MYFELGRLLDKGMQRLKLRLLRGETVSNRDEDVRLPEREMLRTKLGKAYVASGAPVDLILYYDNENQLVGDVPVFDDSGFKWHAGYVMRPLIDAQPNVFRRVWVYRISAVTERCWCLLPGGARLVERPSDRRTPAAAGSQSTEKRERRRPLSATARPDQIGSRRHWRRCFSEHVGAGVQKLPAFVMSVTGARFRDNARSVAESQPRDSIETSSSVPTRWSTKSTSVTIWKGPKLIGGDHEAPRKFAAGMQQAVTILDGLISRLEERRADLDVAAPVHRLRRPGPRRSACSLSMVTMRPPNRRSHVFSNNCI